MNSSMAPIKPRYSAPFSLTPRSKCRLLKISRFCLALDLGVDAPDQLGSHAGLA